MSDNNTLIRGLPGHVVGVHTMAHGYVETKMSSSIRTTRIKTTRIKITRINTTRIKWRSDLSSGTVSQEELGWMSRVVAGELEASVEAARPNTKRIGDIQIPAAGWAVLMSQGRSRRDAGRRPPRSSAGGDDEHHQHKSQHADHYSFHDGGAAHLNS